MAITLAPTEVVERVEFTLSLFQIEHYRDEFGPMSYDVLVVRQGPRAEVELLTDMHLGHGWIPEQWREWRTVGNFTDDDVLVVKAVRRRPVKTKRRSTPRLARRASRPLVH